MGVGGWVIIMGAGGCGWVGIINTGPAGVVRSSGRTTRKVPGTNSSWLAV